jgi:DNA invertase Pin-like site-specific DNA recombinase
MKTKQKAVIYSRLSGNLHECEWKNTLEGQQKTSERYAELNGFEVVSSFRVAGSSISLNHQSTFSNVIKYMEDDDIHILICKGVDRLSRSFANANLIDEWLRSDKKNEIHFTDNLSIVSSKSEESMYAWSTEVSLNKMYRENLKRKKLCA